MLSLAIQQLCLSPADGSANPGLVLVLQVIFYDFFLMFLMWYERLLHSQPCFCALQNTGDFFRSSELYTVVTWDFFLDHSVLKLLC